MKLSRFQSPEGRGAVGCIFYLLLFIVAVYAASEVVPVYYANLNFSADAKTEVSRAGAKILGDDRITDEILNLAEKNDINLEKDNIKIEHFPGELRITVHYEETVNFVFFKRVFHFTVKESSFVGTL